MKDGCDGEIYNDEGERIPEENASYENLVKNMRQESKDEILKRGGEKRLKRYLDFESAWRVPDLISKRFLGEALSRIDGENLKFTKYAKK